MSEARVRDVTSRLELRRRKRTRGLLLRILAGVVVAALLGGLVYLFGFSPVLAAHAVTVSGTRILSRSDVLDAAAVSTGTPLARVDAAAVAQRVAGLPAVAQVTVTRDWPDDLQIQVTERKARLAIPAGGGYLLADASGVVFQATDDLPSGLILVDADTNDPQLLVDVGTVYSSLSSDTAAKVARLEAPSRDGIEFRFHDGTRVVWGSAEDSAIKSQVLDDLLPKGGSVFDVSAPGFPTRR